jgi:actin-like ATPase involved in cell morphogenesis
LLFDSSPLLPSAVFAAADGRLVVGRDALHHARFAPGNLEPNPKRRIDEERVLLGDREVEITDLIAAILRHVHDEAVRVSGGAALAVAVTHPAGWGPVRRLVLADSAAAAGLGEVTLVPEPAAAAHYFTGVMDRQLAADRALVVYDFGAGTFDASVVRPTDGGFQVVAIDGLADVGGIDVDAAVIEWLRTSSPAEAGPVWARLTNPETTGDARERHLLWDDVRTGKEVLSRSTSIDLRLPLLDREVPVTRAEFDRVAGPLVERTVRTTAALVRHAQLDPAQIGGVFLVGGSSRIPLVGSLLERTLGVRPTAAEQPELVVAEGSLHTLPMPERTPVAAVSRTTGGDSPTVVLPATPPVPQDRHNFPETVASGAPEYHHFREVVPARKPRRTAGWITLAVAGTTAALVAVGAATHVLRLPHRPSSAAKPSGQHPSSTPTGSTIVPAGWHTLVTDPLSSPRNWSSDKDTANTSSCAVGERLTVAKKTSGTYRCKGPITALDDQVVQVDVTLLSANVCGGIWLRFGPAPSTGAEAGYLLEVCRDSYVLVAHGLPDTSSLTPIDTFPVTFMVGKPARVGVLARGTGFTFYLDGKQVGHTTSNQFTSGRTLLGIVVPVADSGNHQVAFANVEISKPAT